MIILLSYLEMEFWADVSLTHSNLNFFARHACLQHVQCGSRCHLMMWITENWFIFSEPCVCLGLTPNKIWSLSARPDGAVTDKSAPCENMLLDSLVPKFCNLFSLANQWQYLPASADLSVPLTCMHNSPVLFPSRIHFVLMLWGRCWEAIVVLSMIFDNRRRSFIGFVFANRFHNN